MRYLLVVVTHGASPRLGLALDSFRRNVVPPPERGLLYIDGPDQGDNASAIIAASGAHDWTLTGSSEQRGFCNTVADAWAEAVVEAEALDCDHVFWLESDFIVHHPVDVRSLAQLLDREPVLAQVALMRQACNSAEAAAGGLFESRPGEYDPHFMTFTQEPIVNGVRLRGYPWLLHRSYFTTNPSLMRREFMAAHPWPLDELGFCEGRFGLALVAAGLAFAVWGSGEPWVEHVGVRTGFGY